MAELFANDVATALASPVTTTTQTSFSVVSSAGFPTPAPGTYFRARLGDELVAVTAVSGTTWTVERGIEGTSPSTHVATAVVTHVVTAGALARIEHSPIAVGPDASPPESPEMNHLWLVTDGESPTAPENFAVQGADPGFSGPGMWVQTGLGPTGADFTIWIEDGT